MKIILGNKDQFLLSVKFKSQVWNTLPYKFTSASDLPPDSF